MAEEKNVKTVFGADVSGLVKGGKRANEVLDEFEEKAEKASSAIETFNANLQGYIDKVKAAAKVSRDIHQAFFTGADATLKSSEALRKETEALLKRSRAGDEVARKNLEWRKGQQQVAASTNVVTGSIAKMQRNLMALQAAMNATQNSKRQLTAADRGRISALKQLIFQQRQLIQAQKGVEKSQRPGFIGRIVRSFIAWRLVINTLAVAFSKLKQELIEGYEEVYGQTEAYTDLQEAVHRARNALVVVAGELAGIEGGMEGLAEKVDALTQGIIESGAAISLWVGSIDSAKDAWLSLGNAQQAYLNTTARLLGEFLSDPAGFGGGDVARTLGEEFTKLEGQRMFEAGVDFGDFDKTVASLDAQLKESLKDTEAESKAVEGLIRLSRQWDKELERHDKQLQKIRDTLKKDIVDAAEEYRDEIEKIDKKLADTLEDIAEDAQKDVLDAIKKGNAKVAKQQEDDLKDIERMQAEHNLRMRHMQEQFNLSRIQSDRFYQFERGMLVAEGDVLAIEELDARHKLEQQAEDENFELRKRQTEELFQLQLQYQKEAAREQAAELRKALQDQLKEIAENARDKADQAMEDAEEARGEARDQLKQDLMDAQDAADKKLEIENDRHEQARKDQAQARADLAADLGIEVDPVVAAMEAIYGPDGKLAQMTDAYYVDRIRKEAAFRAALAGMQAGAVTGGRTPLLSSDMPLPTRTGQYGGEFIASRPTRLVVGEGHRPERVVVQPLSAISGNVTMRWGGGPIPIHGSGLGGADPGGIQQAFNSIVPGMMYRMSAALRARRGRRGY